MPESTVTEGDGIPYEVSIAASAVGYTTVRMDLTPDEAALLARVGERIASASHGERSLTVAARR